MKRRSDYCNKKIIPRSLAMTSEAMKKPLSRNNSIGQSSSIGIRLRSRRFTCSRTRHVRISHCAWTYWHLKGTERSSVEGNAFTMWSCYGGVYRNTTFQKMLLSGIWIFVSLDRFHMPDLGWALNVPSPGFAD